ncbi:MAG: M20/M25/M40 family metallo-hydrolase [Planctomycetota bacterium]
MVIRVAVVARAWLWAAVAAAVPAAEPPGIGPQEVPASSRGAPPATADAAAAYREVLTRLCDPEMGGRSAGSPGGARAIAWIEGRLLALGLEPAVGESLRQEFAVPEPLPPVVLPATACALLGPVPRALAPREFEPFPFSPDGRVSAEVVFAGHGLVIPELGLDDYRDLDVRDKVVLLLRGGPDWRADGAPVRRHMARLSFRSKTAEAANRGAAAVLMVERGDRATGALDAGVVRRCQGGAAVPFVWLDRDAVAPWFEHGLDDAQRRLDRGEAPVPLRAGAAIELDVALQRHPPRLTANVLARLRGRVDGDRDEIVVVAAHHDHIGRGEIGSLGRGEEIGRLHPGADDNASGVAALLELARRWRDRGAGRRTLVFAAFGAEEIGQAGSRWLLDHPPAGGVVVAMLDLNMIGRAASNGATVYGVGTGEGLDHVVTAAGARLPELRLELRDRTSYRSDQSRFLGAGIPALLITTGLHAQYHRPADVPELVEVDAALQVVDLADAVLRELVDGPRRRFVPARDRK